MRVLDLTHGLTEDMPLFPGMAPPRFERPPEIGEDSPRETRLVLHSHSGTHVDAPLHMAAQGRGLERLPVENFVGRALLADVSHDLPEAITVEHLRPWENSLKTTDFLLLRTGWSALWGKPGYFEGFPTPTPETARWLLQFGLKGIGIDAMSIDAADSSDYPVHRIFLGSDVLVIENLKFGIPIPEKEFFFVCLPLPYPDADGSPVRAVAIAFP